MEDSGSKQSRVWRVMEDKIREGRGMEEGGDSALRSLRTCLSNFYREDLHFYTPSILIFFFGFYSNAFYFFSSLCCEFVLSLSSVVSESWKSN